MFLKRGKQIKSKKELLAGLAERPPPLQDKN
jgi:hypothetical protein